MSGKKLTGSFVALITPFNKDGSVDFAAFRTLIKFQEDHGTGDHDAHEQRTADGEHHADRVEARGPYAATHGPLVRELVARLERAV